MSYRGRKALPVSKSADEYDAFSSWRRWLKGLERPGIIKGIRRKFHKRARREAKNQIRNEE